jgi:hypothetical protein
MNTAWLVMNDWLRLRLSEFDPLADVESVVAYSVEAEEISSIGDGTRAVDGKKELDNG